MAAVRFPPAGVHTPSTAGAGPSFSSSIRHFLPSPRLPSSNLSILSSSKLAGAAAVASLRLIPARRQLVKGRRSAKYFSVAVCSAVRKLSEAELVPIPAEPEGLGGKFPAGAGVYGVYDRNDELQFVGISRNVAASIASHRKALPELCRAVKVGLVGDVAADRTVLTDAWKSWLEEHIETTRKVPPGNKSGDTTWTRKQQKKPDLRLTPGRHVQLTVPLEQLIDRLVKENKVVAFIKGSRSSPLCGFSQRVVGILESHGVDYESVDVLDEEYNYGLRETLKSYSNWPTFPQIFVRGELIGGCDILNAMDEKGEIEAVLKN